MRQFFFALIATVLPLIAGCTAKARLDLRSYETRDQQPGSLPMADAESNPALVAESGPGGPGGDAVTNIEGAQQRLTQTQGWRAGNPRHDVGGDHQVHVVREGETLYSIAQGYSVPLASLFAANGLVSDSLVPGQHVIIPAQP